MLFKNKNKDRNTYGIVGLGRFGYALAVELAEAGADIIALDRDEDIIREIREYTENAFVVKSLDKKTLAKMNADLGRDVEADDDLTYTTAEDTNDLA